MSNVVGFPNKHHDLTHGEKYGTLNRNLFTMANTEGVVNTHPLLFVITTLSKSKYVEWLTLSDWGFSEFEFAVNNNGDPSYFNARSTIRADLCPEFGCQLHTEYLRVTLCKAAEESITKEMPDDLLQNMTAYFEQFGETSPSQKISFNYAVLASLIEYPSIRYVSHGVVDSKFVVRFLASMEGVDNQSVEYTADFLPILLDSAAIKHNLETNVE